MKQLAAKLQASDNYAQVIWFVPWRHEKSDALWAAFATTFVEQVSRQMSILQRLVAAGRLAALRFNWQTGWFEFTRTVATAILWCICFFAIVYTWRSGLVWGPIIAAGAIILSAARQVMSFIGNPLSHNLGKHLQSMDYASKSAFIEQFHRDFGKVVESYTLKKKTFVFVDDLDRCEVPTAAELMQALNLLIADEHQIFFIIGLDREKVAAGIAAKHEKVLKYLHAQDEKDLRVSAGLNYGLSFLEKFIQLPFQLPTPRSENLSPFLAELRKAKALPPQKEGTTKSSTVSPEPPGTKTDPLERTDFTLDESQDSEIIAEMVRMVAPALDYNPRRLKQFINLFRLRIFICAATGLLDQIGKRRAVTLPQLAKFVAISLRWPMFLVEIETDPTLLRAMYGRKSGGPTDKDMWWIQHAQLTDLLRFEAPGSSTGYSLLDLDLSKLMAISPLVPRAKPEHQTISGIGIPSKAKTGGGKVYNVSIVETVTAQDSVSAEVTRGERSSTQAE